MCWMWPLKPKSKGSVPWDMQPNLCFMLGPLHTTHLPVCTAVRKIIYPGDSNEDGPREMIYICTIKMYACN